jgi:hypothetical protein
MAVCLVQGQCIDFQGFTWQLITLFAIFILVPGEEATVHVVYESLHSLQ